MTGEWVKFGEFSGYLARAKGTAPGVIVVQEVWGANEHIQDVARRIASAGYVALAPELYWRGGAYPAPFQPERLQELLRFAGSLPPGGWHDQAAQEKVLAAWPADAKERVMEAQKVVFANIDAEQYLDPLIAGARFLQAQLPGEKTVAVGFCMGGKLAARLACREPNLAGAAIFYGRPPADRELDHLHCPVAGFYGGLDKGITDGVPAFAEKLKARGVRFESHIYPTAGHAFFNDTRSSYNADASRHAWAHLLTFLNAVTSPP